MPSKDYYCTHALQYLMGVNILDFSYSPMDDSSQYVSSTFVICIISN